MDLVWVLLLLLLVILLIYSFRQKKISHTIFNGSPVQNSRNPIIIRTIPSGPGTGVRLYTLKTKTHPRYTLLRNNTNGEIVVNKDVIHVPKRFYTQLQRGQHLSIYK
jgi:hypothetical protein